MPAATPGVDAPIAHYDYGMAMAAQVWVYGVRYWIDLVLLLVCLGVELFAVVNCALQRSDAFGVVGRIPKGGWIVILVLALVLTYFLGLYSIFGLVGVTAALFYLLDVRRGLRDALEGPGSW
jgi:hypothetical protein